MDYIGATPQVNPLMGLLAERLKQAQQFATKPFGYSNPPAEVILNLLGIPAVQQTAERLAYGEPLTTGRGMTTQIRPEVAEAALTVAPVAGLLGKATKGLPVGASIKNVDNTFDVVRRDASDIFGAGAERVMYKDPKSGGTMEVLAKPDGTASVLSLEVPETSRGKGIGQSLQAQVMQDFPEMMGQVSSKAAAKTAYRLGRRPPFKPDATLEDVYKMMDEDSSVNMISPEMQKRFVQEGGLLGQSKDASALPVEQSGLLQSPRSLTMPEVPTAQQMEKYGRIETVPLSSAVSFQSARNWETFGKNPRGDLIKGYGDKPVALRLETGEYVIYDGNHRTDLALKEGKSELPMHVIDVKAYDPAHAGRKPVPPSMSADELLRSLLD
jgi:predicted GNAT family acetyltransferase